MTDFATREAFRFMDNLRTVEIVHRTALDSGWTEHEVPTYERLLSVVEYRRKVGRRVETVRVTYNVRGAIIKGIWAPRLDGIGGRRASTPIRAWVLDKLTAPTSC